MPLLPSVGTLTWVHSVADLTYSPRKRVFVLSAQSCRAWITVDEEQDQHLQGQPQLGWISMFQIAEQDM